MAQVKINKERFVEGRFTVKQRVVDTDEMIIDEMVMKYLNKK